MDPLLLLLQSAVSANNTTVSWSTVYAAFWTIVAIPILTAIALSVRKAIDRVNKKADRADRREEQMSRFVLGDPENPEDLGMRTLMRDNIEVQKQSLEQSRAHTKMLETLLQSHQDAVREDKTAHAEILKKLP